MAKWEWYVSDEIAVVGQNGEYADMVNPQGYLYGRRFYAAGCDERGNQVIAASGHKEPDLLLYLVQLWNTLGVVPCPQDCHTRAAYGSEAYLEYQIDEDIAEEMERDRESMYYPAHRAL